MKTIFRKVSVKEKLPQQNGICFTSNGLNYYSAYEGFSINKDAREKDVEWWLEEIELPTDEEIKMEFPKYGKDFTDLQFQERREGAEWMRDFVLAVAPLTSNTNSH